MTELFFFLMNLERLNSMVDELVPVKKTIPRRYLIRVVVKPKSNNYTSR